MERKNEGSDDRVQLVIRNVQDEREEGEGDHVEKSHDDLRNEIASDDQVQKDQRSNFRGEGLDDVEEHEHGQADAESLDRAEHHPNQKYDQPTKGSEEDHHEGSIGHSSHVESTEGWTDLAVIRYGCSSCQNPSTAMPAKLMAQKSTMKPRNHKYMKPWNTSKTEVPGTRVLVSHSFEMKFTGFWDRWWVFPSGILGSMMQYIVQHLAAKRASASRRRIDEKQEQAVDSHDDVWRTVRWTSEQYTVNEELESPSQSGTELMQMAETFLICRRNRSTMFEAKSPVVSGATLFASFRALAVLFEKTDSFFTVNETSSDKSTGFSDGEDLSSSSTSTYSSRRPPQSCLDHVSLELVPQNFKNDKKQGQVIVDAKDGKRFKVLQEWIQKYEALYDELCAYKVRLQRCLESHGPSFTELQTKTDTNCHHVTSTLEIQKSSHHEKPLPLRATIYARASPPLPAENTLNISSQRIEHRGLNSNFVEATGGSFTVARYGVGTKYTRRKPHIRIGPNVTDQDKRKHRKSEWNTLEESRGFHSHSIPATTDRAVQLNCEAPDVCFSGVRTDHSVKRTYKKLRGARVNFASKYFYIFKCPNCFTFPCACPRIPTICEDCDSESCECFQKAFNEKCICDFRPCHCRTGLLRRRKDRLRSRGKSPFDDYELPMDDDVDDPHGGRDEMKKKARCRRHHRHRRPSGYGRVEGSSTSSTESSETDTKLRFSDKERQEMATDYDDYCLCNAVGDIATTGNVNEAQESGTGRRRKTKNGHRKSRISLESKTLLGTKNTHNFETLMTKNSINNRMSRTLKTELPRETQKSETLQSRKLPNPPKSEQNTFDSRESRNTRKSGTLQAENSENNRRSTTLYLREFRNTRKSEPLNPHNTKTIRFGKSMSNQKSQGINPKEFQHKRNSEMLRRFQKFGQKSKVFLSEESKPKISRDTYEIGDLGKNYHLKMPRSTELPRANPVLCRQDPKTSLKREPHWQRKEFKNRQRSESLSSQLNNFTLHHISVFERIKAMNHVRSRLAEESRRRQTAAVLDYSPVRL
ncbi:unnamed protein product [Cyprideis torosa]|uniref:Uncharacterized protein n=1 Tax=Cyprideis torosa TaxID=163714 RepID=A0A7R8ZJR4_9CRUS|nr:unnamed protein product [Cyprideis torosa]CAG0887754.1 unnamed protein product [Cyprideis torosa]